MSRILLADDSPHAQRMGEFILREDGFEVVSVTDGETAMLRLADVDPDLVLAHVSLPRKNGYELCSYIKSHAGHHHTRVVLTAGALEPIDEAEALRVQADGSLRKPFEASSMIETAKRLVDAAMQARQSEPRDQPPVEATTEEAPSQPATVAQPLPEADPESVRAAVTLALESALPVLIDEITHKVLAAFEEARDGSDRSASA